MNDKQNAITKICLYSFKDVLYIQQEHQCNLPLNYFAN